MYSLVGEVILQIAEEMKGCSDQIWSGQDSGVSVSMQQVGGLGACPPPRKFLEFRGYKIASETIFGPKQCLLKARQQGFTCINIIIPFLPIVPYSTGFGFPIVC